MRIEDISFKQYLQLIKGQSLDRASNIYHTIAVLYSLPIEEVESYSVEQIEKLFANIPDFTNYVAGPILAFELFGTKYYATQDAKDLNFRQYIDLDFYENKYKDNPLEMATYLLAVICLPLGEKYDNSAISQERGVLFQELPFITVLGIFNYFIKKKENYSKVMELCFLVEEMRTQQVQTIESSVKNGVGTSPLTRWLRGRYWNKIKFLLSI